MSCHTAPGYPLSKIASQHNKTQCAVILLVNHLQAAPFPIAHFHPHKISPRHFYAEHQCLHDATHYLLYQEYAQDHKTVDLSYRIQRVVLCCLVVFYSMHLADILMKQVGMVCHLPFKFPLQTDTNFTNQFCVMTLEYIQWDRVFRTQFVTFNGPGSKGILSPACITKGITRNHSFSCSV